MGGELLGRVDGVCLGVRSYVEGGLEPRGAGGRGASVGLGLNLRT